MSKKEHWEWKREGYKKLREGVYYIIYLTIDGIGKEIEIIVSDTSNKTCTYFLDLHLDKDLETANMTAWASNSKHDPFELTKEEFNFLKNKIKQLLLKYELTR